MFAQNQEKMMRFMILNQDYGSDKKTHKEQFDHDGLEIQEIVEEWCNKLCHQMEKGQNNQYSNKLADKFLAEVQKYFPYYHEIGMKIRTI